MHENDFFVYVKVLIKATIKIFFSILKIASKKGKNMFCKGNFIGVALFGIMNIKMSAGRANVKISI